MARRHLGDPAPDPDRLQFLNGGVDSRLETLQGMHGSVRSFQGRGQGPAISGAATDQPVAEAASARPRHAELLLPSVLTASSAAARCASSWKRRSPPTGTAPSPW